MPRRNRAAMRTLSAAAIAASLAWGASMGAYAVEVPTDTRNGSGTSTAKEDSRHRFDVDKKKDAERAISVEMKAIQVEHEGSIREAKLAFDTARKAAETLFKAGVTSAETIRLAAISADAVSVEDKEIAQAAFEVTVDAASSVKKESMRTAEAIRNTAIKAADAKKKSAITALTGKPVEGEKKPASKKPEIKKPALDAKAIQAQYTAALAAARKAFEAARDQADSAFDMDYDLAQQDFDTATADAFATDEALDAARVAFDRGIEAAEQKYNTTMKAAAVERKAAYQVAEAKRKAALDALKKADRGPKTKSEPKKSAKPSDKKSGK